MSRIVLASGSPRRQELLNRIGITDFDIRVPQTDEHYPAGLTPAQIVEYISREKADAAAKLCTPEEIVITADTMVFLDDQRLGKPQDEADALRMLTALQGRRHTVCTGVSLRRGAQYESFAVSTGVTFRRASDDEIRAYIKTGEPPPANLWTKQGPTVFRARARCWWSVWRATSSTSWACLSCV